MLACALLAYPSKTLRRLFAALPPPLEDGLTSPEGGHALALTPGTDPAGASPLGRPSCGDASGGGGSGAPASGQQRRPPFPRSRTRSRTTPRQALPAGVEEPNGAEGGALVSPGSWRRQPSPGVNLLALLQSPHPPARTDLFMSPGLKVRAARDVKPFEPWAQPCQSLWGLSQPQLARLVPGIPAGLV